MTPQEQDMIADLIDRVQKTQLTEKDPDAEQMLLQGLKNTPDAVYILAQTVLVQKYALEQAQTQLAAAKDQIQQLQQHPEPKHATSFLGSLLGMNQSQAAPPPPPPPPPPQGYAPAPQYAPVGYGYDSSPGYGPGYGAPPPRQGGGFLQNAMQTAAGVAAGALAFEGVESLMHGFGHAAGYGEGSGFGGFGGGQVALDLLHGLDFCGEFEARLAAGFGFAEERLGYGCGASCFAQEDYFDFEFGGIVFDPEHVADAHVACRLGKVRVGLDTAHLAGLLREGAGLEEARGPEPLVDADGGEA